MDTRKFIVVVLLFFLSSSCAEATKTDVASKQWLQRLACTFPCWQNITPNETSFESVMSILKDAKVEFRSVTEDEIDFTFEENTYGSIHKASDGTVDAIILSTHNVKLNVNDLEQVIGTPEKIHLIRDYDGRHCQATLLYPEYGTVLEVYLKNRKRSTIWWECRVNLTSESDVFRIVFVSKNFDGSEFWQRAYSAWGNQNKEWGYSYMEWKGYGSYPKMDADPLWEH